MMGPGLTLSLATEADDRVRELKAELRCCSDDAKALSIQAKLVSAQEDSAAWHTELEALPGLNRPH